MSETFTATISGGGKVLAQGVRVRVRTQHSRGGTIGGEGEFTPPEDVFLMPGQELHIESDDGWTGNVLVVGLSAGSHQQSVVRFKTNGRFGR